MVGCQETGNETYVLNLINALWAIDSTNTYLLLTNDPPRLRQYVQESERFQVVGVRPGTSYLRIPFAIPWTTWQRHIGVLHMTYNAPPLSLCPTVVTVHDISFASYPEAFSLRDRLILSTLVPLSMRRAAKVITVSHASKTDIIERYRVPEDRIVVIPEAASDPYQVISDRTLLDEVRARYGTGDSYILAVGNLQPRKNLIRLVEAYSRLRATGECKQKLVMVGKAHWQESQVFAAVRKYGLEGDVIFTGYVPEKDLVLIYNAATVFVYPSLYEGFGLPPLEAMACGTPVVASRAGAIPEVVGDGGLLVSPLDVDELASAILAVLRKPELRKELAERGQRRARQFSWLDTARRTLTVYQVANASD